ncbi:MAG: BLUF domain-containing protein, partial [Planctomycetota bacterium]
VYRLIYSSIATVAFSSPELVELLRRSRISNAERGITGMLLYHSGSFLQVLEGEREEVESLFRKIERDPRHGGTLILVKETGPRTFGEWSMGFAELDAQTLNELEGANDFLERGWPDEINLDVDRARWALEQFRFGRWRRAQNA